MSAMEHVEALKTKHSDLDKLIAEEESRPHPDDIRITELKRQKLKIKDEINHLAPH
ncbi:hypothetical protein FRZ44_41610 [Hypericibacter terrae]|jgi:hypothetical protein|uniref:DUF465 domain-containing protein n=1 Tax=Hypericibacter terrae TaxID=2602015 RepID=A0A5J6MS34_9PROT|nr:YdcH family protein [Hypericibacter terrae]QEX18850.1 hypothetical protein FRZ44_41610 [Hypericibacter terrae]